MKLATTPVKPANAAADGAPRAAATIMAKVSAAIHADAPPFFVVHGDNDTLAPIEDCRRFVELLLTTSREPVAFGEMQGAQHAFDIFPSYRTARVVEGVERFLTTMWERRHQADEPAAAVEDELAEALTE